MYLASVIIRDDIWQHFDQLQVCIVGRRDGFMLSEVYLGKSERKCWNLNLITNPAFHVDNHYTISSMAFSRI